MKQYHIPTVAVIMIEGQDILTLSGFERGSSMWFDLESLTTSQDRRQ